MQYYIIKYIIKKILIIFEKAYKEVNLMNKTKRKIFETSMKLFAQKGYDATSIEEITATVGVAKGTLYYHF